MKIAIHDRPGSFSDRWIAYCREKNISYKVVNAYDSDIVAQVADCDAFMWHHHQSDSRDILFAKQLLFALQQAGKVVFPDFNAGWHFDDKVGEKYLLEAIGAPLVPSYVFYNKKEALEWCETAKFPKVFKLRGGAGSVNVRLVKNLSAAKKLVSMAFGKGFKVVDRKQIATDAWKAGDYKKSLKNLGALLLPFLTNEGKNEMSRQKGYILFQDFIPGMKSDTRVVVIGNRAFALTRMVRKNDFRASGSGISCYDKDAIDERCVKAAFDIANRMFGEDDGEIGFDFLVDDKGNAMVIEMSYGFVTCDECPGFWESRNGCIAWNATPPLKDSSVQALMVDLVVKKILAKGHN
ncbi:MAG: hypothetical protein LUD52_02005 [Opitutae bacterium]|nr:hypothetical protein [Opitutae bacterium]